MATKMALVLGAGGFIGGHLVKRLKREGLWVRGVDRSLPEFAETLADDFVIGDLRERSFCDLVIDRPFAEVYQLAADLGGAGYISSGRHDADILRNSALVNINVADAAHRRNIDRVFCSSSAAVYPARNQDDPDNPDCAESSAYPAAPDSEYGWEKLFAERLFLAYNRNYGRSNRVARFHNVFGPEGTWTGGREKVPAAICRKVAMARSGGDIEIWGDGNQSRSFLYIDECLEGSLRLMRSGFEGPLNVGSDELVTINQLVDLVCDIAGKTLRKVHVPGPIGVRGRNSDNRLIEEVLGWRPTQPLRVGLERTYDWIEQQVRRSAAGS